MTALVGAALVLPDRVVPAGTLVLEGGRIVAISTNRAPSADATLLDGHTIVPGFVDAHVHGVDGIDALDAGDAIARLASRLPRYGVTAFSPTTVACAPDDLARVLAQIRRCRASPADGSARVLGAHLESNFISRGYAGAQPRAYLRTFDPSPPPDFPDPAEQKPAGPPFSAEDLLRVIDYYRSDIAVVTLAPELPGGLRLIEWLCARGIQVSLGHSGATYDEGAAAIQTGARQGTHLFNRMPPFHHRAPGLIGALLDDEQVTVEVICDGVHVHPSMVRTALAMKGVGRVMAITDGTAAAGCREGTTVALGSQTIVAGARSAVLADGTLAGGLFTMDRVFQWLTISLGLSMVEAATICSTTPARARGCTDCGLLAEGAAADLAVLDTAGRVVRTYLAGQLIYDRNTDASNSQPSASV